MKVKKQIDTNHLKRQIAQGKSLNEVSISMGKSKSSILKKANELGLKFTNKSHWNNL